MTRINKPDLVATVADEHGTSQDKVRSIIDMFLSEITAATAKGAVVYLSGFGTFTPRTRAARMGRNPATGAPIQIAASTALTFKAAKKAGV